MFPYVSFNVKPRLFQTHYSLAGVLSNLDVLQSLMVKKIFKIQDFWDFQWKVEKFFENGVE